MTTTEAVPTRSTAPRTSLISWSKREALTPYGFLLPSFVALGIVFFYPMLHAVVISFYSDTASTGPPSFVGLDQYRQVVTSTYFPRVIRTSIIWTLGNVIFIWGV